MQTSSTAVLVIGMHRTGTSVTMGALQAVGVDLGQHLLPPGPDNETGYWEDESILDLNDRLMAALGMTWSSVAPMPEGDWAGKRVAELHGEAVVLLGKHFGGSKLWGFKNPRCIRLLPFWQGVLADVGAAVRYVVTFRNPEAVAASLAFRNQFTRGKSYFLWLSHYVPYLDRLLKEQCLFLNYDRLMDEPRETIDRLFRFVHGSASAPSLSLAKASESFLANILRQNMRHARARVDDLDADAPHVLKGTFTLLEDLVRDSSPAGVRRRVATLQKHYYEYALLLRQVDESDAVASKLKKRASEQEPIRDMVKKMGLYQADIHKKLEQADLRYEEQNRLSVGLARALEETSGLVRDAQEKVSGRIDQLQRELARKTELMAVLEDRVGDIQEKVVVQMDELHRELGLKTVVFGELDGKVTAVRDAVVVQGQTLGRLAERMGDLQQVVSRDLEATRNDARAQLDAIYRSTSWRITQPIRTVKVLARKFLALFRH